MKTPLFRGIATALVTPFHETGVDTAALERLVDWQIREGIDALVVCGTTGEISTLTYEERELVTEVAVKTAARRVPILVGTGTNDTQRCIHMTRVAAKQGADGALVVTPYYNKATQRGLLESFTQIADQGGLPVVLYNVPSRTGVNIEPETLAKLAQHPNIVGLKEANGDISKIVDTFARAGDDLPIYSGNDDQIVPILSMGGCGCISVLSNLLPAETCRITRAYFSGDTRLAAQLQCKYVPLISALFSEVNPIPAKAAMAAMGMCENRLRLPLTQMEPAHEQHLLEEMRRVGIDVSLQQK